MTTLLNTQEPKGNDNESAPFNDEMADFIENQFAGQKVCPIKQKRRG